MRDDLDRELVGFINIDKPEGWTSHDVVAKLRKILKLRRIGHAGTLDPFATGVLPIAVGPTTRLLRFLPKSKCYLAEIDLRNTTDTDDLTGQPLRPAKSELSEQELLDKFKAMEGDFDQIPPLYSAKKINGKKLYELMREGQAIDLTELKAKTVRINYIKLLEFDYPMAKIEVSCGEGTYIRSIARDVGGHLTLLRRLESNGFDIKSAIRFEDLEDDDLELEDLMLDVADYIDLPEHHFSNKEVIALQQGQRVRLERDSYDSFNKFIEQIESGELYLKCMDTSEDLVGLAHVLKENKSDLAVQPKVML